MDIQLIDCHNVDIRCSTMQTGQKVAAEIDNPNSATGPLQIVDVEICEDSSLHEAPTSSQLDKSTADDANVRNVQLLKPQPDGSFLVYYQEPNANESQTISFIPETTKTQVSNSKGSQSTDYAENMNKETELEIPSMTGLKDNIFVNSDQTPLVESTQTTNDAFWDSLSRMVKKELIARYEGSKPENGLHLGSKVAVDTTCMKEAITSVPGVQPISPDVITVTVPNVSEESQQRGEVQSNNCSRLLNETQKGVTVIPVNKLDFGGKLQSPLQPEGRSLLQGHQRDESETVRYVASPAKLCSSVQSVASDYQGSISINSDSFNGDKPSLAWCLVPRHCFPPRPQEGLATPARPVEPPEVNPNSHKLCGYNLGYFAPSDDAPLRLELPVLNQSSANTSEQNLVFSTPQRQANAQLMQHCDCIKLSSDVDLLDCPPLKISHVVDGGEIPFEKYESSKPLSKYEIHSRRQHNAKEKARRAKVKSACDLLRNIVPGMTTRTDKATVFQYAYEYIKYLKKFASRGHEKEFLMKSIPEMEESEK